MPDYTVHDPRSGRTVTLTGDSLPTENELNLIFAKVNAESPRGTVPPPRTTTGAGSPPDWFSQYERPSRDWFSQFEQPPASVAAPRTWDVEVNGRRFEMQAPQQPTADQIRLAAAALQAKSAAAPPALPVRTWTDTAVDALPAIGGAVGGAVGGAGGTVAGFGVGGVPGAVGGAALGGGAGEAARQLIERMRGKAAPASPGEAATGIAEQAGLQGGLEGAGQAVSAAVTPVAKAVYRGYLKPSLSKVNIGKAAEIVDTAFRENLPVTHGALTEAGKRIGELKAKVDTLLANASGDVNLGEVANRVRLWANQMFNRAGRAPEDLDAAMQVADRIDSHPSMLAPGQVGPPNPIVDLSTANQVKRDLQAGVGTSQYGIPSRAGKSAEKVGAREVRLAIESQAPGVGPLNAREGQLIDLARAIERGTAREANQNKVLGVKTMLAAIGGGEAYRRGENPYAAAAIALTARIGMTPAVATRAALLASHLAEKVPGTAVADVARAAVQAAFEASGKEAQ